MEICAALLCGNPLYLFRCARVRAAEFLRKRPPHHSGGKNINQGRPQSSPGNQKRPRQSFPAMIGRPVRKGAETAFGGYLTAPERRFCIVPASSLDKIRAWSILKNCGRLFNASCFVTLENERKTTQKEGKEKDTKTNCQKSCNPFTRNRLQII